MTDLQLLGPPGSELNLRKWDEYLLERDGFQSELEDDVVLTKVPGGVLLARDDVNYETLTRKLLIFGAGRQEMRMSLLAVQNILADASLYERYRGTRGVAAFYTERLGNESSATIRQVVTGRCREISREGSSGYLTCELRLTLKNPL